MKMKKMSVLICAVMSGVLLLSGCGSKADNKAQETALATETASISEDKEKASQSPEDFIKQMYEKCLIENEADFESMWEDYFSDRSKQISINAKDKYLDIKKTLVAKNNIKYTGIEVTSSEKVSDDVYKVHSVLKYNANGKDENQESYEYVINENGQLKYLSDGILSEEKKGDTIINNINYKDCAVYYSAEPIIYVKMSVCNNTGDAVTLGWVNAPTIQLDTDKGQYTAEPLQSSVSIQNGGRNDFTLQFKNVDGTPQSITINNINFGLAQPGSDGVSHTIKF